MRRIELIGRGRGRFALVDDEDYDLLIGHRWRLHTAPRSLTAYARALINGRDVLMHRLILKPARGVPIDHIDGDGLNNRRANLQLVTHRENCVLGRARRLFDSLSDEL